MEQLNELVNTNITIHREVWIPIGLLVACLLLYWWGFFRAFKRIIWECLIDHTTGKVSIINVARFSMILVAIWKLTIGVPTIELHPEIKFTPNPEDDWEIMLTIFGFIGGTQWIFNKYQLPLTKDANTETKPQE